MAASGAGNYYNCNRFKESDDEESRRKDQSKAALERYLHYYSRYVNHHNSLKLEEKTRGDTERKIEEMQQLGTNTWLDVQYLKDVRQLPHATRLSAPSAHRRPPPAAMRRARTHSSKHAMLSNTRMCTPSTSRRPTTRSFSRWPSRTWSTRRSSSPRSSRSPWSKYRARRSSSWSKCASRGWPTSSQRWRRTTPPTSSRSRSAPAPAPEGELQPGLIAGLPRKDRAPVARALCAQHRPPGSIRVRRLECVRRQQ